MKYRFTLAPDRNRTISPSILCPRRFRSVHRWLSA
jgi:hypothetical protein